MLTLLFAVGSLVDREAEKDSEAAIVTFSDTKYSTMTMSEQRKQLPVYKHRELNTLIPAQLLHGDVSGMSTVKLNNSV